MAVSLGNIFAQVPGRGGSSYLWYYREWKGLNGFSDCYGVIKNFHLAHAQAYIKDNLQYMYNQGGQRRLNVMIFHARDARLVAAGCPSVSNIPGNGTIMKYYIGSDLVIGTADDVLELQYLENLYNYVDYAASLGFKEFMVMMSPQSANWPGFWSNFDQFMAAGLYAENRHILQLVYQTMQNTGRPFKIVLADEPLQSPHNGQYYDSVYSYVARMWSDYFEDGGNLAVTGGITMADATGSDIENQVNAFLDICDSAGYGRPLFYVLNIFGDEQRGFTNFHQALIARGSFAEPVIIGSTFYNDSETAYNLRSVSNKTGRVIEFVLQWPKMRANGLDNIYVSEFFNYAIYGF
ncbi:MAG: hypothetical protein Q8R34_02450 [bacterium]|nr:hypothetical protein [bacterium]